MSLFNTKFDTKEIEYQNEIIRLQNEIVRLRDEIGVYTKNIKDVCDKLESRDKTIENLSAAVNDLTKKLCYPVLNTTTTEPKVKLGRKKKEVGEKKSPYRFNPDRALSIETKWRRISKLRSKGLSWAEVANKMNGSLYATIAFYKYHKHKFEEKRDEK